LNAVPIEASDGRRVWIAGRPRLCFAGTSLLGLAQHPEVLAAAREALERCGLSATAARATSGNFAEHEALEHELAAFLGAPAALLFPDGWLADAAVLGDLSRGPFEFAAHAGAHASLTEPLRAAGREVAGFGAHAALPARGSRPRCVVADGLYPSAARRAAPAKWLAALDPDEVLLIDDSHGLGYLGPLGRGCAALDGCADDPRVRLTGSLAKQLGATGGFAAGPRAWIEGLRDRAPQVRGTTPIPPAVAAGARAALRLLVREPERLERLRARAAQLDEWRVAWGLARATEPVPVLALPIADAERGRRVAAELLKSDLFAPYMQYGDEPGALRVAISALHTDEDVDLLRAALEELLPPA
jgi:8-amino-7-oxononanoate synthase